jgi:hypothetical protein
MISNEQIRIMCAETVSERDAARLKVLLAVLKTLCTQYIDERSLFLASKKSSSADQARNRRISKTGKKAA